MVSERFIGIKYSFNAGPRELFNVPEDEITETNCQALTLFHYRKAHGLLLHPEEVLSSNVYATTGEPVAEEKRTLFHDPEILSQVVEPGHLLCALDKRKFPYEPPFEMLERDEALQKTLHLATVIGTRDSDVMRTQFPSFRETLPSSSDDVHVFHACYKKGKKVNVWTLQDMVDHYWVMRIKDLGIPFPPQK